MNNRIKRKIKMSKNEKVIEPLAGPLPEPEAVVEQPVGLDNGSIEPVPEPEAVEDAPMQPKPEAVDVVHGPHYRPRRAERRAPKHTGPPHSK